MRRPNIVKISVLPKLVNRCNAIQTKILQTHTHTEIIRLSVETSKLLKLTWKCKEPGIANQMREKI